MTSLREKVARAVDANLRGQCDGSHYVVTQTGKFNTRSIDAEIDLLNVADAAIAATLAEPTQKTQDAVCAAIISRQSGDSWDMRDVTMAAIKAMYAAIREDGK